jgi:hypothetical protein
MFPSNLRPRFSLLPQWVRCGQLSAAALALLLGACLSRAPTAAYTQRFDACMHQLERDKPEMTTPARDKSCTNEVGPPPFDAPASVPAPVH